MDHNTARDVVYYTQHTSTTYCIMNCSSEYVGFHKESTIVLFLNIKSKYEARGHPWSPVVDMLTKSVRKQAQ